MNDIFGFSILVDGVDIKLYGMKLQSYEIQSYVKRKTNGIDIPGAHGTQAVPSALASNSFVAKVICTGHDVDDVQAHIRRFFAFMYSNTEARKIVFTDDMGVARYAILDSPDKYKVTQGVDNAMAELKLTFYMLDPFMHNLEQDRIVRDLEYGQIISVFNEAYECPAVYTMKNMEHHAVSEIALIVNNELVTFSCTLEPGDELVLDTREYEVRLNGNVRLDYWEGEMPHLKNGENFIYHNNAEHANLLTTVEFTKLWV